MSAIRKKLVIIGDIGCGKTSLLTVFCRNRFPEGFISKVFESYVADIEIDGKEVQLAPWDTVADGEYSHLRPQSYDSADMILMCFSLDSVDSFDSITKTFSPEVQRFCPNVPIVLVGTKQDLLTENFSPITSVQGILLAEKIKACAYVECSAKNKVGVREVFELATRVAMIKRHNSRRIRFAMKRGFFRCVLFLVNKMDSYFINTCIFGILCIYVIYNSVKRCFSHLIVNSLDSQSMIIRSIARQLFNIWKYIF